MKFSAAEIAVIRRAETATKSQADRFIAEMIHVTTKLDYADDIFRNGVNPAILRANNRFGFGFYLSQTVETGVLELKFHGKEGTHAIRFRLNVADSKVLDLTNPKIAKEWGYLGGEADAHTKAIGTKASALGFQAIRFRSVQNSADINVAILSHFDELLKVIEQFPIK